MKNLMAVLSLIFIATASFAHGIGDSNDPFVRMNQIEESCGWDRDFRITAKGPEALASVFDALGELRPVEIKKIYSEDASKERKIIFRSDYQYGLAKLAIFLDTLSDVGFDCPKPNP
jgi:hypothetical protein